MKETVFCLSLERKSHKATVNSGGLREHCVVHDLVVGELLDSLNFCAMRFTSSTILNPIVENFATVAIAMVLECIFGQLLQTNSTEARVSSLTV